MTHKVFVSYHHDKDQLYANEFRDFYGATNTIIDRSLPDRIDSDDPDYVLGVIRTQWLKDSTVTIVLVGTETWSRKWVDWEVYSSLRGYGDRTINGLLGIVLPEATRWPDRLLDNYREELYCGRRMQAGYARVVSWFDVAPPANWRAPWVSQYAIAQRRQYLTSWIEAAFQNRSRTDLIVNTRERMQHNRSVNNVPGTRRIGDGHDT